MSSIWDLLSEEPTPTWDDDRLVKACLEGNEPAWQALIEKYQRLIYSVPRRQGLLPDDAAEVFQLVCVELYQQLGQLRNTGALKTWLIRVATRSCYKVRRQAQRSQGEDLAEELPAELEPAEELLVLERQQLVRDAIRSLSERCRKLVHELFFIDPPRPYQEVANGLGLAVGSIGFIRGRCLEALRKAMSTE